PAEQPTGKGGKKGAAKRAEATAEKNTATKAADPAAAGASKPAENSATQTAAASTDSKPAPRPSLGEKFAEWLARERERTVAWQPLRPASAKSNLPLLTIEGDASVFASGDISKA